MLKRTLSAWMAWTVFMAVPLEASSADTSRTASEMTSTARSLVDLTPQAQRPTLLLPFTLEARTDWHYVPRNRPGVAFKAMEPAQRQAAHKLLATALSEPGLVKIRALFALEIALREMESFGPLRDPDNYAFAIFGTPDAKQAWGWRIEGHHLSLHFTLEGGQVVATLPQFVGANPSEVPRDFAGGPRKGQRLLGEEEDRAFALFNSLSPAQRTQTVFSAQSFGDIVSTNAGQLDPLAPVGIPFSALAPAQQALLLRVIESMAAVAEPSLAQQRLERVREGGLDGIRFGWAGAQQRNQRYYWRIQGPGFLIEWDNTTGNHHHSVWRDFKGDWGRDVLGEHYRRAQGGSHKH